jgi:site-specific DNA-methyltransferase (adenine-specific)
MDEKQGLPSFPDNYFDLAIVDPPYGIDGNSHRKNDSRSVAMQAKNYHPALWDQKRPTLKYFQELNRVSKNQIIWGGNHLMDLIVISKLDLDNIDEINKKNTFAPCWLTWDKHTGENNFSDCELAFTSFKTAVRKFSYPWNGMIQGFHGTKSKNEDRIHPTQKPIALYKWLLTNYAKKGDLILDTHVGSASSLVAFEDYGFDYVGFELDEHYYSESCKRLEIFRSQMNLFRESA